MITYGSNNLRHYRANNDELHIYLNIVKKAVRFDTTFATLYECTNIERFREQYSYLIDSMDYKNTRDVEDQVKFIHLVPYGRFWLPKYCCCISCMEDEDFFDDIYYYFQESQLRKQLKYIKKTMEALGGATILVPFCADNKIAKDDWSNYVLPAIIDVFAKTEDVNCVIIPPLED